VILAVGGPRARLERCSASGPDTRAQWLPKKTPCLAPGSGQSGSGLVRAEPQGGQRYQSAGFPRMFTLPPPSQRCLAYTEPSMPQCQRTQLILGPVHKVADRCWRCPGFGSCGGDECYVEVTDEEWAMDPFAKALEEAKSEFSRNDSPGLRLWSGLWPQTIQSNDGVVDVYLHPTAFPEFRAAQTAFQSAHEAVHLVCGPRILHWTHELVAVRFAFDHLTRNDFQGYADLAKKDLEERASDFSTSELLAWKGQSEGQYASGLHARAYVLGEALIREVGWPAVRTLALWPDQTVDQWLDSLPASERAVARATLGL
jgi:hypothetical protein